MSIRIAIGQFNELTEEKLRFAAQIGATGIQMNTPDAARRRALGGRGPARPGRAGPRRTGSKFEAIENVPVHFYDKVDAGPAGPRRADRELLATRSARSARAGIPVLGYHFMPNSVWRTERLAPGRGGAGCTAFDMAAGRRRRRGRGAAAVPADERSAGRSAMPVFGTDEAVIDAETMWANYDYFITRRAAGGRGGGRDASRCIPTIRRCRCSAASRGSSTSRPASSGPRSSARAARPGRSTSASAAARRCRAARPTCAR